MNTFEKLAQLYERLQLIRRYGHAISLLNFDMETICPHDAKENEGDTINFFSNELFKVMNASDFHELVTDLYAHKDELEELDQSLIDKLYDSYQKQKNISPELDLKANQIYTKAYLTWLEAKEKGDYALFKGAFADVIDIQAQLVDLRENKLPDLYDTLLNDCEKGVLTCQLDPFFLELKAGLIDLIQRIKESKHHIRTDFLNRPVAIAKQEAFSKYLLNLNGYDFNAGALSTTEHPFTIDIARHDARVTTHYYENNMLSNVYSVVHEGGHAIFMQNERDIDHDHFINDYITNGMHESVSRFFENVIGRSREYVHLIYPKFQELFNEEFSDVSEEELYEAINIVEPSLIRTEADEVTYGLHIVIRYEMEKLICQGKISLDDVPNKWNALYKEYLGVTPTSDKDGVLQDVHWTSGFGYFPSYALGNAYNAMYVKSMMKAIDLKACILDGDFKTINHWLKENVFAYANVLTPEEWLKKLTGENLSPKAFLAYLNAKYSEIYHL